MAVNLKPTNRLTAWTNASVICLQTSFAHLLGSHCPVCNLTYAKGICPSCQSSLLNDPTPRCQQCALALNGAGEFLCGQCLQQPPPFTHSLVQGEYRTPIDQLIHQFKYRGHCSLARDFALLLLPTLIDHYQQQPWPQLLIPVPLHPKRLRQRGYNQAALLTRQLSRHLNIPQHSTLLQRHRHSDHQQGLSRDQRLRNLKGCFSINATLRHRHIALVDDVMTTAATVTEASRTLLDAGAIQVDCWCLARAT